MLHAVISPTNYSFSQTSLITDSSINFDTKK